MLSHCSKQFAVFLVALQLLLPVLSLLLHSCADSRCCKSACELNRDNSHLTTNSIATDGSGARTENPSLAVRRRSQCDCVHHRAVHNSATRHSSPKKKACGTSQASAANRTPATYTTGKFTSHLGRRLAGRAVPAETDRCSGKVPPQCPLPEHHRHKCSECAVCQVLYCPRVTDAFVELPPPTTLVAFAAAPVCVDPQLDSILPSQSRGPPLA